MRTVWLISGFIWAISGAGWLGIGLVLEWADAEWIGLACIALAFVCIQMERTER